MLEVLFKDTHIKIIIYNYNPRRGYPTKKTMACYFYKTGHCVMGFTCRYKYEVGRHSRDGMVLRKGFGIYCKEIRIMWNFTSQQESNDGVSTEDWDTRNDNWHRIFP